jgi:hypothetical protein
MVGAYSEVASRKKFALALCIAVVQLAGLCGGTDFVGTMVVPFVWINTACV